MRFYGPEFFRLDRTLFGVLALTFIEYYKMI